MKIWMGRHSDNAVWYCVIPITVSRDGFFVPLHGKPAFINVFDRSNTEDIMLHYLTTTLVPDRKTVYEVDL